MAMSSLSQTLPAPSVINTRMLPSLLASVSEHPTGSPMSSLPQALPVWTLQDFLCVEQRILQRQVQELWTADSLRQSLRLGDTRSQTSLLYQTLSMQTIDSRSRLPPTTCSTPGYGLLGGVVSVPQHHYLPTGGQGLEGNRAQLLDDSIFAFVLANNSYINQLPSRQSFLSDELLRAPGVITGAMKTKRTVVAPNPHLGRPPTFPRKLHQMLTDLATQPGGSAIASFIPSGQAFVILKPRQFTQEVLPKYFHMKCFNSFQRQVNLYNFQRLDKGSELEDGVRGAYYHKLFVRDDPQKCLLMKRQKIKGPKAVTTASVALPLERGRATGLLRGRRY